MYRKSEMRTEKIGLKHVTVLALCLILLCSSCGITEDDSVMMNLYTTADTSAFGTEVVVTFTSDAERTETIETERRETTQTETRTETEQPVIEPAVKFSYTRFTEEVFMVGEAVRAYLAASPSQPINSVIALYHDGSRLDQGDAVAISCEVTDLPQNVKVDSIYVEMSEDSSYTHAEIKEIKMATGARFYHLKTGTTYYYRVTATLSDGTVFTGEDYFTTAKTPRILRIGGIRNVRDIGGWNTADGRCIKQGLLYRGTELDGAVEKVYCLTPRGKKELLSLGVRTDMDLRMPGTNPERYGPLGEAVNHIYYDAAMYKGIFTESGRETMRKVFVDLAKPERYPIYLHCTYGCDRTGTVCMLLEALLGVSKEDVIRDYELTGLLYAWHNRGTYGDFMMALEALEGATLQKKVENYLLSIGVTTQEIESIRTIFLSE